MHKSVNVNIHDRKPIVLLAGSTGYIGKTLQTELLNENFTIICPVRNFLNSQMNVKPGGQLKIENINVCSESDTEKLYKKYKDIDIIISCIGVEMASKKGD